MINVYEDGKVIARVERNNNLDRWNGHNWNSGEVGEHLGLTRLKDGRFVAIHTTQIEGGRDRATIISREDALQLVLYAENEDLLDRYFEKEKKELDNSEEERNS